MSDDLIERARNILEAKKPPVICGSSPLFCNSKEAILVFQNFNGLAVWCTRFLEPDSVVMAKIMVRHVNEDCPLEFCGYDTDCAEDTNICYQDRKHFPPGVQLYFRCRSGKMFYAKTKKEELKELIVHVKLGGAGGHWPPAVTIHY